MGDRLEACYVTHDACCGGQSGAPHLSNRGAMVCLCWLRRVGCGWRLSLHPHLPRPAVAAPPLLLLSHYLQQAGSTKASGSEGRAGVRCRPPRPPASADAQQVTPSAARGPVLCLYWCRVHVTRDVQGVGTRGWGHVMMQGAGSSAGGCCRVGARYKEGVTAHATAQPNMSTLAL